MPGLTLSERNRSTINSEMNRGFLAAFAVYLIVGCPIVQAQSGPTSVRTDRVRQSIGYDQNQWTLIKQTTVRFAVDSTPSQILLMKSRKPTGSSGLGEPMNDVRLVIRHADRILYDHTMQFFVDEHLEIRDVIGDGSTQVLFHSGSRGASDSSTLEHVLRYDRRKDCAADVAPEEFFNSGTHGLRWLTLEGRAVLVIADRNWASTIPLEQRCHYCSSPFRYNIFRWNKDVGAFTVYMRLKGKKSYDEATEALNGDWEFIRRFAGCSCTQICR
jgi:hypothetical protein